MFEFANTQGGFLMGGRVYAQATNPGDGPCAAPHCKYGRFHAMIVHKNASALTTPQAQEGSGSLLSWPFPVPTTSTF